MAKIVHSGIGITNSRGKLNNEIHSRNRGGNYSRGYTIPTNTISFRKTEAQNNLALIAQIWSVMPQSNRDEWNQACMLYQKQNKIGNTYFSSGFNMFVGQSYTIFLGGGIPSGLPVKPVNWHVAAIASVNITSLVTMLFTCRFTDGSTVVPANTQVIVRASVGVSVGINSKRSNLTIVKGWLSGASVNNVNFWFNYWEELGDLVSGTKIFFNVFSCNGITGQRSTPLLFTAIVP